MTRTYFIALLSVFMLFGIFFPGGAEAGTWQLAADATYSDMWCPATKTASDRIFPDLPSCTKTSGACSNEGSLCKVNTVTNQGSSCFINSKIYSCAPTGGSCPATLVSPGGCSKTGNSWEAEPNISYGSASGGTTWTGGSSLASCQNAGMRYCTQVRTINFITGTTNYTTWGYPNGSSPYRSAAPEQTTPAPGGGPATKKTTTSYVKEAVYSCTNPVYDYTCTPAPTASLSASPVSIVKGTSSTLTSKCTNSTSASISQGVGTVSASGTTKRSVSPTKNTKYTLTCTGEGGTDTASVTVAVTDPTLTASCKVSPASIQTGGSATWTASPSGGTGSYSYSWSGTNSLSGSSKSVTKTYTSAGTKTGKVTVTSGTQNKTVNCSNSLAVSTPPPVALPDLTASSVSAPTATEGKPVTLSGSISNQGTAGTGSSFANLFQRATSLGGANTTDIGTHTTAAIGPGNSRPTARTYTFPSAQTWYVRICADKSSGGSSGVITESNENNNCGPWTPITVEEEEVNLGTLSCSVNPSSVVVGGTVTYSTSGSATPPFIWTPSDGQGSYGNGSTASRTFTSTGSYGMTVGKTESNGGGGISANCPVVVAGSAQCTNPSAEISANPDRVRSGDTTTISWNAGGVDGSCTISGPGVNQTVGGASCTIPNGSANPTITRQSVYSISCDSGESVDEVVVNVIPRFIEF